MTGAEPVAVPGSRVFVSHAGADTGWAEWVAWHLKAAGYSVELDRWDWGVGDNFVTRMNGALAGADVVVALYSKAYFEPGRFTDDEWTAVIAARRRLVPLRVERVDPPDILRPVIFADLFDKGAAGAARELLAAVGGPQPAATAPDFPGREATQTPTPRAPRLPGALPLVWNVPPRNPAFTGRDAVLAGIRRRFTSADPFVVQALHGEGGVGKTSLAIEFAHRFAADFEAVWWVDAEVPELVAERLASLATEAELVDALLDVPTGLRLARRWLRATPGWLLIFDNATEPDALRRNLPDGPGRVLITSHDARWSQVAAHQEVDVFAPSESVDLLRRQVPAISEADAMALAGELGDLPLALAQAAAFMAETGMAPATYRRELQAQAAAILAEGTGPGYPLPLAAAVRVAVDRVGQEDAAARELLEMCAVLAPEPIPVGWFTSCGRHQDGVAVLPPAFRGVAPSIPLVLRCAGRLARFGLVRASGDTLGIHRLRAAVIRALTTDLAARREAAAAVLVAGAPGDPRDPRRWAEWATLLPHLGALNPVTTNNGVLRRLACDAVTQLRLGGETDPALELARSCFEGWRERLGPDHPDTLRAATGLAASLFQAGEFPAARALGEETLAGYRRVLGEDHPDTLRAATGLAASLFQAGEFPAARALGEETLAGYRRVLGPDHPDTRAVERWLRSIEHDESDGDQPW